MHLENPNPKVFSIKELTSEIENLFDEHFDFVWVEGEISNFRMPSSGHYYLVLKDDRAQIRAVMFRPQAKYLRFIPEDGMKVVAQGKIAIYASRGEYQIIIDYLEPLGTGALALAFEQLKKKLAAHGVFDASSKKPLPFLPRKVAVITSPTGAAIKDFLKVIYRRFANLEIIIVPVRVQGDEACLEIVNALETVNRELDVDVIVLTRGGGSFEDLNAFNQEEIAYAIKRSKIPVVSAIGHEIDITISDMAADLRAPTPSAAAELLVVEKEAVMHSLKNINARLVSGIYRNLDLKRKYLDITVKGLKDPYKRLSESWIHIDELNARLMRAMNMTLLEDQRKLVASNKALGFHTPFNQIRSIRQQLDAIKNSIIMAMERVFDRNRARLLLFEKRINDLNPLSILRRGYSITSTLPLKKVIRDSDAVKRGDHVRVMLAKGELLCLVEDKSAD